MRFIIGLFLATSVPGLLFAETSLKINNTPAAEGSTAVNIEGTPAEKRTDIHVKSMTYKERLYGLSSKSEIGDRLELDFTLLKNFSPSTSLEFGLEIDPEENSLLTTSDSKAQRFEISFKHEVSNFVVQADFEIDTNKNASNDAGFDVGGISLGFDPDSEGTFLGYKAFSEKFIIKFFPFNFDTEVGDEFNSWDVARLFFIEGAPSTVNGPPTEGSGLNNKTIPGLTLTFNPNEMLEFAVGGGVTSYLYPTSNNFDIRSTTISNSWERRQDFGLTAKTSFTNNFMHIGLEYAWHDQDQETGSLLRSAGSLQGSFDFGNVLLGTEIGMSQAGRNAYRLAKGGKWFEDEIPFLPVYSSRHAGVIGEPHSWLGQTDFAYMLKAGIKANDNFLPYLYYKFQGEDFIYRDPESAHNLRTADDTLSHGGLHRVGFGAKFKVNDFTIQPDLEFRRARYEVFNKSAGIQDDFLNSSYRKSDYLLSLVLSYSPGSERNKDKYEKDKWGL